MKKLLHLLFFLLLAATGLQAQNLVAYYPLNGNGNDVSQYNQDATIGADATFVENRFGFGSNALQGTATATLTAETESAETSISFWVKMNSLPANGEVYLLSHGGYQERWKISLPGHGKPVFTTNPGACCNDMDSGAGNELVVGEWAHLVMVHGGGMDMIYLNGGLVAQRDATGDLGTTQYPLGIGYDPIGGGNVFDGAIDDVQLYNGVLSAEAIADLYAAQNTAPVFDDTLVADYSFDGNGSDNSNFENSIQQTVLLARDRFDRANKAANFNGTFGITAANSPQLISDETTISFWVNPTMLPENGEVYLLSHGGYQERWKISLPGHGKPVFTTNPGACCNDMDSGDGNELVVGEWSHLVMVHGGGMDMIFLNGELVAQRDATGDLVETQYPLGIGFDPIGGGNFFNGRLDDIQIYNEALSAEEIKALYDAQSVATDRTDEEAPSAPGDLEATINFTNIQLNWSPSTDNEAVISYNVYQDGVLISTVENTAYNVEDLAPTTEYTFGVTAVDDAGNESEMAMLTVTSGMDENPDGEAPSIPGNFKGSPSFNSVLLSWTASTDNTGVTGYVILVDGEIVDTVSANVLSYLAGGLDPETLYTFEVYAFDAVGNNSEIAEITISTTEPLVTAEPGLVAHYPFEGNANDVTPYMNHGQIGGNPTFETADHPQGGGGMNIKFDGMQDSVLVPNAVQLISDYTSVSFWIRVDGSNPDDAEAYILDFGHWDQRWKISLPNHLKIVWTTNSENVQFDNFISDMDSGDGNEMVMDFWWHVTMVHDGTNDIIYVNGIEVNRKPVLGELNSTSRPFGIGSNPVDGGQYFQGGLDEVKIYNRALTSDEVQNLFDSGTVGIDKVNLAETYIQQIFPNPTTDYLLINHSLPATENLQVRIFDLQGRQIHDVRLTAQEVATGQFKLNVQDYPQGTYWMNLISGQQNLGALQFSVIRE